MGDLVVDEENKRKFSTGLNLLRENCTERANFAVKSISISKVTDKSQGAQRK